MEESLLAVVRGELDRVLVSVLSLRTNGDTTATTIQWAQLDPIERDELDRALRRNNEQLARLLERQALLERILHAQEQIIQDYSKQSDKKEHAA